MAVYNSSIGVNRKDLEETMIDHPYHNDPTDSHLPMVRCPPQASSRNENHDYVFVDQDSLEAARQIEQILNCYRTDLKQESNTQVDCSRKMIIRLIDFIRPVYSADQRKMKDFDALAAELSKLHDKRADEQKEKNEQLQNQIRHLRKSIISTPIERIDSMVDYEQWMEMEEEIRKLHSLVVTQRDRINELVNLISEEETSPVTQQPTTVSNGNTEKMSPVKVPIPTDPEPTSDTENNEIQTDERPTVPLHPSPSSPDKKKCPICNYEFARNANEFEILHHVQECLTSAGIDDLHGSSEPKQYECPCCQRQFLGKDERLYIQHISDCYNERADPLQ